MSVVFNPKEVPLSVTELAEAVRVHRTYIHAMLNAGFTLRYGSRGTVADYLKWREEHPEFRYRMGYPQKRAVGAKRNGVHSVETAGKADE